MTHLHCHLHLTLLQMEDISVKRHGATKRAEAWRMNEFPRRRA